MLGLEAAVTHLAGQWAMDGQMEDLGIEEYQDNRRQRNEDAAPTLSLSCAAAGASAAPQWLIW